MVKPKIKTIKFSAKCSDLFAARLFGGGKQVGEYLGYVPKFFPGQHYGDYVDLEIDISTGKIINWKKPTQAQLWELIKK